MIYTYEIGGGKVALDNKPPRHNTPYVTIEELPAGPRDSLRIVDGELISSAPVAEEILKTQSVQEAKDLLVDLDSKSIRSIREFLATMADAPQSLKDLEAGAIEARETLK